ncbi:hypothetical protein C8R46DRAFT_1029354 [Mycena filopes]|nr:hypothetical protein C8R46DRAFT_1029354 [Mycena filopes]
MRLDHDKERYNRQLVSHRPALYQCFLKTGKTIKKQIPATLEKVIALILKNHKYFQRFHGGWPIRVMIRQYLSNNNDKFKRALRHEQATEDKDDEEWEDESDADEMDVDGGALDDEGQQQHGGGAPENEAMEEDGIEIFGDDAAGDVYDEFSLSGPSTPVKGKGNIAPESPLSEVKVCVLPRPRPRRGHLIMDDKTSSVHALSRSLSFVKAQNSGWPSKINLEELPRRIHRLFPGLRKLRSNSVSLSNSPVWRRFFGRINHQVYAFSRSSAGFATAEMGCSFDLFLLQFWSQRTRNHPSGAQKSNNGEEDDTVENDLYRAIADAADIPVNWSEYEDDSNLISLPKFTKYILIPHVAASPIAEDLELELGSAMEVLRKSQENATRLTGMLSLLTLEATKAKGDNPRLSPREAKNGKKKKVTAEVVESPKTKTKPPKPASKAKPKSVKTAKPRPKPSPKPSPKSRKVAASNSKPKPKIAPPLPSSNPN